MNKHERSVQEIENIINADREQPVELEIALQVTDSDGIRTFYPGIQIHVPGTEFPVFISVGELQLLASAANNHCTDLMEKNQKKNNKKKIN